MIKILIDITSSKRDLNGNCYHFATLTRVSDGEQIQGIVDSASNCTHYLRHAGLEWKEFHETQTTLPIRQFNQLTKTMSFMNEEKIIEFVKEGAAKQC